MRRTSPHIESTDPGSAPSRRRAWIWTPARVVGVYALIGALWILASRWWLASWVSDATARRVWEVGAGWVFVLATALVLYLWLRSKARAQDRSPEPSPQLRESEARYRTVIETASDAILSIDESSRIRFANPAVEEIFGYAPSELLGQELTVLMPEEMRARHRAGLRRYMETGQRNIPWRGIELTGIRRDGREIPLEVSFGESEDGGHRLFTGVVRDIRKRREAETQLRRYAERLETLRETGRALLEGESPQEIAREALPRIRGLVGCARVAVILFDHARGEATLLAVDDVALERGAPWDRISLADFGPALSLRADEMRIFDDLSEAPTFGVRDYLVSVGLRSLAMLPLYARDQMIGVMNLASDRTHAFAPEHLEIAREVAAELALAVQHAQLREELRRHTDELEALVEERTQRLQEINEELEAFTFTVSHDLRAPLRALEGLAQALLEDYGSALDPSGHEYAQRMVAAARRMDQLIQDLLAYSRLARAELRREAVPLEAAVESALRALEREVRDRDAVIVVERPLPLALGDSTLLAQALHNLISNAIKFSAPGVRPQVRIGASDERGLVRIWVQDNGIGIAPEHQTRIFKVFERLHGVETYPGTGIGLGIVKKAAERMGGRVGVESQVGKGSRFWIQLVGAAPASRQTVRTHEAR